MSKKKVKEATEAWREVLEGCEDLREKHEVFRTAASQIHLDFAGPGLSEAMQRMFHKRNFTMFMEDYLYEHHRKGGVSHLTPPKSSSAKKQPTFAETEE
jgi:hypothetical protein